MICGDCRFLNTCPVAHGESKAAHDDPACNIGIEVERLRKALKPFAVLYDTNSVEWNKPSYEAGGWVVYEDHPSMLQLTIEDFRAAQKALETGDDVHRPEDKKKVIPIGQHGTPDPQCATCGWTNVQLVTLHDKVFCKVCLDKTQKLVTVLQSDVARLQEEVSEWRECAEFKCSDSNCDRCELELSRKAAKILDVGGK